MYNFEGYSDQRPPVQLRRVGLRKIAFWVFLLLKPIMPFPLCLRPDIDSNHSYLNDSTGLALIAFHTFAATVSNATEIESTTPNS